MATRSGETYGRLTVLYQLRFTPKAPALAVVQCVCGNVQKVRQSQLRNGKTKSCGCARADACRQRATKHGLTNSPTWESWRGMIERCTNPKHKDYALYGGRGITFDERWRDFVAFLTDMGERLEATTLDRFPNKDGDYEPGNCRWATAAEQTRNKRSNVIIEHDGVRMILADWAREIGVHANVLYNRINEYGWSAERAIGRGGARFVAARDETIPA